MFSVTLQPPSPGDLQPFLQHMSVTTFDLPGANWQPGGLGARVIHVLLTLAYVAMGASDGCLFLLLRLQMRFQAAEHFAHFVL